jgi:hypothetical protein
MPQKYPHRNQLKYTRKRYRFRNWNEYEAGLRRRGDLTIWFSEDALKPYMATKFRAALTAARRSLRRTS